MTAPLAYWPLTYWHSGGEVMCAGCRVMNFADTAALGGLYLDEARAAAGAGNATGQAAALRLARELSDATAAAGRWRRAGVHSVSG